MKVIAIEDGTKVYRCRKCKKGVYCNTGEYYLWYEDDRDKPGYPSIWNCQGPNDPHKPENESDTVRRILAAYE